MNTRQSFESTTSLARLGNKVEARPPAAMELDKGK